MHTKAIDSPPRRPRTSASLRQAPAIPDTLAYWLEHPLGTRVTKLYRRADTPMVFAGRPLERFGHVDGWALVRRDTARVRHVVASGPDLAELARPFMAERTPEEAVAMALFFDALGRIPDTHPIPEVTDERVY